MSGENIFKRKDGRWEARYIKSREISGKIRYGFCYGKSYREAKEKVEKIKAALLGGFSDVRTTGRHKLAGYCEEWLGANRMHWKESTYVRYVTILDRYIRPKLGDCPIDGVTQTVLTEFSRALVEEEGLSPTTAKDVLLTLHGILKYAAREAPCLLPAIAFVYPKAQKKEARVLSLDEQKTLMAYLLRDMDACKFGVLLAVLTGMRIGELCAARWENISLEDRTVRVASTMQRIRNLHAETVGKTAVVFDLPKSEKSLRRIPLTELAADLCRKMNPDNPAAFLLTGTTVYMEPRTLQYRFKKYTAECGLSDVHFHTLRHTFATRCVEVGFDVKSLSEILGHASTSVTLERYVHSSMEQKRSNMRKLSSIGL